MTPRMKIGLAIAGLALVAIIVYYGMLLPPKAGSRATEPTAVAPITDDAPDAAVPTTDRTVAAPAQARPEPTMPDPALEEPAVRANEATRVVGAPPTDDALSGPRSNAPAALPVSTPDAAPDPAPASPIGAPPSSPPNAPVEHVVREGESYWTIARDALGNGARWSEIAALNPTIRPEALRPGMRLKLPPRDGAAPSAPKPAPTPAPTPADAGPRRHVVRAGETLSSIARDRLGDASLWRLLHQLNRDVIGSDPDALEVGMVLELPGR